MFWSSRRRLAILATTFLLPPPLAFKTPLSNEEVREAYFLGQRRDGSLERLLGRYTKQLPPPKSGPYISSIALHTPFVQMVQYFSRQSNYSAQQAALDYRHFGEEIVRVLVEIRLTQSYGRFIVATNSPRPHDFWKDFSVQVYDGEEALIPHASHGHANNNCGRGGPCFLIGATIELEFPATAFTSDSANIEVDPPEGDLVSVNFDLSSLR